MCHFPLLKGKRFLGEDPTPPDPMQTWYNHIKNNILIREQTQMLAGSREQGDPKTNMEHEKKQGGSKKKIKEGAGRMEKNKKGAGNWNTPFWSLTDAIAHISS